MTIVSGIKFNGKEGALVADEQASYMHRKVDLAIKIDILKNGGATSVVGGTGALDTMYRIINEVKEGLEQPSPPAPPGTPGPQLPLPMPLPPADNTSGKSILNHLGRTMSRIRGELIQSYLWDNYRLTEKEVQSGYTKLPDGSKEQISPSITGEYQRIISGAEGVGQYLNTYFLALTSDKSGIELFKLAPQLTPPLPNALPYASVGSGSDTGDKVLSAYFKKLPRERRQDSDPIDGMAALLLATSEASEINMGVGGTPYIVIVNSDGQIVPNSNSSHLAQEIVVGTTQGFLPKRFQREALDNLLLREGDYEAVDQEMWKAAGKKADTFGKFLRGYKV